MNKFLSKILFTPALLIFFSGCQTKEPEKETVDTQKTVEESSSANWKKFESIKVEPIEAYDALIMAKNYSKEINSRGKWGDYVRSDIPSMINMLLQMDKKGQTHVKIYFGVSEKKDCSNKVVKNLTLFFEGATVEGECLKDSCKTCTLNESPNVSTYKPYNVVHPCPPPPCGGYSRYYDYSKTEDLKIREKLPDSPNP